VPKHGCVNVHGSLLPRWRGAAPIQRSVAAGDETTGVCLMVMEAGLDTGPVFARREIPIEPTDTGGSMHDKLAKLGAEALLVELPAYLQGQRPPVPQDHASATLAPMLKKEEGALDFTQPAKVLEARLRGFTPWPGAYTHLNGKLLKVLKAHVAAGKGTPGETISASADGIEVACGEGSLVLTEILPEGKRAMSAAQFLSGRPLAKGTKLG
jgi:methionyl-tRNA formyltransferase